MTLDGSTSSDPDGDALTYAWTQTAGPTESLSSAAAAKPTFSAPAAATTLTFQLVVGDGRLSSSPASVTIAVQAAAQINLAGQATASASSQVTATGQLASKAIDGLVDGYPGDYTKEWASSGQGVGAWLKLVWSTPVTISRIVLHDRPNSNDQILAATVLFSDGSSLFGSTLANDGSATTLTSAARSVTSLTITVTAVSTTTRNVGLAEVEVYGARPCAGEGRTGDMQGHEDMNVATSEERPLVVCVSLPSRSTGILCRLPRRCRGGSVTVPDFGCGPHSERWEGVDRRAACVDHPTPLLRPSMMKRRAESCLSSNHVQDVSRCTAAASPLGTRDGVVAGKDRGEHETPAIPHPLSSSPALSRSV